MDLLTLGGISAFVITIIGLFYVHYRWYVVPRMVVDIKREMEAQSSAALTVAVENARASAAKSSAATRRGKLAEQLAPYMPGFNYHPADVRFLGSPIDLVVFDGLHQDKVNKVVIMEVKTGQSSLSKRERAVRDAVQSGFVEWEILRLGEFND